MKIKGTGRVTPSSIKRIKSKKSVDKAAFGEALYTEETQATGVMSGTAPLTSVNSFLSLQEMPSATDGKSRTVERAEGLIEHLEAIRHGLLLGQISKKRLSNIVKVLAQQREKNIDPALIEIINDIELRAKVELAKLEMIG